MLDAHNARMRFASLLLSAVASIWVLLATVAPVGAQTGQTVTWRRYDVDLQVRSDGSVAVSEAYDMQFQGEPFTHGFRVIPSARTTGITGVTFAETTNGRQVGYAPGSNRAGTYSVAVVDQDVRVDWWFSPPTNASRSFVLAYVAQGAVRQYPDGDQLQWQAIYATNRPGDVQSSTVTVRLPAQYSAGDIKGALYRVSGQGSQGALPQVGTWSVQPDGSVRFDVGRLPPNTGAEVRVQFPHGAITAPPPQWQTDADRADQIAQTVAPIARFLALLASVGILAVGGMGLFLLWYSKGRDPSPGRVPARLEEPPSELPAPLAGTLVDGVADVEDAVSTLVDLGQRGEVLLSDEEGQDGAGRDVRVRLQAPVTDPRLRTYERTLLTALFGPGAKVGQEIAMSGARQRFAAAVPVLQAQLTSGVADAGLFVADPEAVRRCYRRFGWILVGAGVLVAMLVTQAVGSLVRIAWAPGVVLAAIGLAVVWLSRHMPRRTQPGALEAARWRAFRDHLMDERSRPDSPEAAEDFRRYMPYAVAFGVNETFLRKLEAAGAPPPSWYGQTAPTPGGVVVMPGPWMGGPWIGPGPHDGRRQASGPQETPGTMGPEMPNPQGWSDALAGLLNAASEAMAHGGNGGGWSGGGFGGGGGGGGGSGGWN